MASSSTVTIAFMAQCFLRITAVLLSPSFQSHEQKTESPSEDPKPHKQGRMVTPMNSCQTMEQCDDITACSAQHVITSLVLRCWVTAALLAQHC